MNLLPAKRAKTDGSEDSPLSCASDTGSSISDVEVVSLSSSQDDQIVEDTDIGMFSIVHPQTDIKVKEKIWAKNFVDLATLLPNTQAGETKTTTKDGNREVTTVSRLGPKRIVNLTTWYQAFQIYADIYCQKYPTQSPNLFRYMSIIQKMAVSYKQWLSYDEKFRQMKATKSLPWDSIHTETYLFCTLSASNTLFCFRPNCQIDLNRNWF